jgi:predicted DNA-binding transcriptional regulator AlpA
MINPGHSFGVLIVQDYCQAIIEHHRVVSEARAAELAGVSLVHFRRLRRQSKGPRFVRLGERRLGYRLGDVVDWIDKRLSDAA